MSVQAPVRPEIVTDEMLEYLDFQREIGGTQDEFGTRRRIAQEFDLSDEGSRQVLVYWKETNMFDTAPYKFIGTWSPEDEAIVKVEIDKHVAAKDAAINPWLFSHAGSDYFDARRATWDMGSLWATTAEGLAQKIAKYYAR